MKIRKVKKVATVILLSVTLFSIGCAGPASPTPGSPKPLSWKNPPAMQIDTKKTYYAAIDTTLGSFKIKFFTQEAPNTVNNFIFLAKQGYYDNVIFHRIMKDFMIQSGDPTGSGSGSPGYRFADELPVKHKYVPGIVAMANAGSNTNGSQFFVCTGPSAAGLDTMPNYTQFGQVIEGMDNVMKIASVPVEANPNNPREKSKPVGTPPSIKSIKITEE
jgi:cyclophilin family peptidyl-prolyl cis-trans isomerase